MNKTKFFWRGLANALGTFTYIAGISILMFNSERLFRGVVEPNFLIPIFMLTLFVLSALITSSLVLGKPLLLYWDGQKKEAVELLFTTTLWMIIFLSVVADALLLS